MQIIEQSDWGKDGDDPIIPRKWQRSAIATVVKHYGNPRPSRGVIYAVTGSGKSRVIAQIAACCKIDTAKEALVISTPRMSLVRQLSRSIKSRLEPEFTMDAVCGCYYTHEKTLDTPIIITCNDSLMEVAKALQLQGRVCPLWICDEGHRSETEAMKAAVDTLTPEKTLCLTATAFRSKPKEGLSLFDEVIVRFSVADALAEKDIIVPWRVIPWDGGDTDLDSACLEMISNCTGPGVVNAYSIDDATVFAQKLNDRKIPADVVHSKMKDTEIEAVIKRLEIGELSVVVYCDLLSEGVDLVWLRHMTLRRRVASRVRFLQELGRGLRYYKNKKTGEVKTEIIVNDPHDLISSFKLTYDAVLSGDYDPDDVEERSAEKEMEHGLQQEVFELMRSIVKAKAGKEPVPLDPMAGYLTQLVTVFDVHGLLDRKLATRDWRSQPASDKQVSAAMRLRSATQKRCVPELHQRALGVLTANGNRMTKGSASDLISIGLSLAEKGRWPDYKTIDKVAQTSLEKKAKLTRNGPPRGGSPMSIKGRKVPPQEQGMLFETKRPK